MTVTTTFKPAWWAKGPHLQTCFASLFRRVPMPSFRPERLTTPDGDFLDLVWVGQGMGPVVVVFHGLGGSVHSPYAAGILHALTGSGFRAVLIHFRGCSGELNRRKRSYHAGDTLDMAFVFRALHQRLGGETALVGLGYSLGANAMLKYLGEHGRESLLQAAVAVSPPMALNLCANRLGSGASRLYQWYLLRGLKRDLILKMQRFGLAKELGLTERDVSKINTLPAFDDQVTAPLHGFRGVTDYYDVCSSRRYLKTIATPTLIVHSEDDPFMYPEVVPRPEELSSAVALEITTHGGHVGFVAGKVPWKPEYWLEKRIPEYFLSAL